MSAVVVCGGSSRRMGRDKALMPVGGRPLWRRVADRVSAVSAPVMLAPGTPGRLGSTGLHEVSDVRPGCGPLAGIVAGLADSPWNLMAALGVDMPCVSPEVIALLRDLWDGQDAVVPVTVAGLQPLHAVYLKECRPALERCLHDGAPGLRKALGHLRVREVHANEWACVVADDAFAININRAEDLVHPRVAAVLDELPGDDDGLGERDEGIDATHRHQ